MIEIKKWVVVVFLAVLIAGLIVCLCMALNTKGAKPNDRDTKGHFCMYEQSK